MYNKVNKRRKLKPGVEMPIRIVRVFSIIMMVGISIWIFGTLTIVAYYDDIQWYHVGGQCINLLIYLFWYGVHELASDLLEYA